MEPIRVVVSEVTTPNDRLFSTCHTMQVETENEIKSYHVNKEFDMNVLNKVFLRSTLRDSRLGEYEECENEPTQ